MTSSINLVSFELDSAHLARQYDALSDLQFENGRRLASVLGIGRGHRVLDVGAGTGRLVEHLAAVTGSSSCVAAIDPLPERIQLARRRLGPAATLEVGHAGDLSRFEPHSFDFVVFNAVFHWIPDQQAALREAARVLKPEGRLGITTVDRDAPNTLQDVLERVLDRGRAWLPYRVSARSLEEKLREAAFELERVETRDSTTRFGSAEDLLAFGAASSFGNFLKDVPSGQAEAVKATLAAELEALRGEHGIPYRRRTLLAVGRKAESAACCRRTAPA